MRAKATAIWRTIASLVLVSTLVPLVPISSAAAPTGEPAALPVAEQPPPEHAEALFEDGFVSVRVVAPEGTDLSKYGHFIARHIPEVYSDLTVYYGRVAEELLPALKADLRVVDVARIQMLAEAPSTRPDPDVQTRERPSMEEMRARLTALRDNPPEPTERPEPTGWWDVSAGGHNAIEAWLSGYTGAGVRVAVNDSGVDMAHPDFWGTEARYQNVTGFSYYDYFDGWPIALDPIANYLMAFDLEVNRQLTSLNTFAYGITHFADTSATGTGDTIVFNSTVYTTTGTASPANPVYHIGYHPDWALENYIWGERIGVLVVDEDGDDIYDTVYVDLNNNKDFRDDKPVRKDTYWADNHVQGADELAWWDADLDGYPDVSGGMLYFIADGYHCPPFFDVYFGCATSPHGGSYPPPGNGDMVAFMFVNLYDTNHGQLCASNVVAQGKINGPDPFGDYPDWKPDGTGGMVQGMGLDAWLVPVGDIYWGFEQSVEQAWWFQALGYDGVINDPSVPGGDDNMQASSNSFGPWQVYEDGWDEWSRVPTYINYFVNPYTTFFMSSGNTGAGYGTTGAPQPITAIQVGASSQYESAGIFEPVASLDQMTVGDISNWSSRGPSANNQLVPHMAANGSWGTGDMGLNEVGDGWIAWDLWGGTSRSGPVAMGAATLLMDAYAQNTGDWPSWQKVRQALMQGANHINYDPLVGGTGYLNAGRSAHIAGGNYGILVTPDYWDAGDYEGDRFPGGFAHIAEPGVAYQTVMTVTNVNGTDPITVTVSDYVLEEIGVYTYTFTTADISKEDGAFLKPDYFFDVEDIVGGSLPTDTVFLVAELLHTYDTFDANGDDKTDSYFRLNAYDWTDLNGDGNLWEDINNDTVVNWDEVDDREYVRINRSYWESHYQMLTVGDPLDRVHDGLFLGIRHRQMSSLVPTTPLTLRVILYRRADWGALDTSSFGGTYTFAGGETVTATLVLTAPTDYGLYEGAVLFVVDPYNDDAYETIMPVMVNVAYSGDLTSEPVAVRFGDADDADQRYSNGFVRPIFDWMQGRATGGDWRFFFLNQETNPNDPGRQTKLIARTWWDADAPPADIDTFLLGPDYYFSSISYDPNPPFNSSYGAPGGFWGPYSLRITGASESPLAGSGHWYFNTATGSNEDYTIGDFNRGLNGFQIHSHRYDGTTFREDFAVEVGYVDAPEFLEWDNYDTVPVTVTTNLTFTEDVTVTAFGLSPVLIADLDDEFVPGPSTGAFGACYATYFHTFTVASDMSLLHIYMDDFGGDDLDLFLLYDSNGNGQPDCASEAVAQSGNSAGAPEEINYADPLQGTYWVAVDPYAVGNPAGTTCDILIDGLEMGPTIQVTNVSAGTFGPSDPLTFDVFNAPGTCSDATQSCLGGWVRISLDTNPPVTLFDIPVNPRYSQFDLDQSSLKSVSDASVLPGDVLTYTIEIVNTSTASGTIVVTDVLPSGVSLLSATPGYSTITTGTLVWSNVPVSSGGGKIVSAEYDWVDISNPSNAYTGEWISSFGGMAPYDDDEGVFTVTLPFTFTFFGNDYTTAWVDANGQLQFGAPTLRTRHGDGLLPGDDWVMDFYRGQTNDNRIAALFGDQAGPNGTAYWSYLPGPPGDPTIFTYHDDNGTPTDTSDDRFIIQWDEWPLSYRPCASLLGIGCDVPYPDNTYQLILYPDGRAKVQYAEVNQIPPSELVFYAGGVMDFWNPRPEAGVEGPGDWYSTGTGEGYAWHLTPASGLAWMYVPYSTSTTVLTVTVQVDDPLEDTSLCNDAYLDNGHGEVTWLEACATVRQADLEVSKSVEPTRVREGDTITFTATITNNGPLSTTITFTDTLDTGLAFGGLISVTGSTSYFVAQAGQELAGTAFLTESAVFEIVYTATVTTSVYGQTLCNGIEVDNGFGSRYNDYACVDANVVDLSNSEKHVWWSDPYPWPGTVITYEVEVHNDSLVSTTVWVTDVVPADVTFGGIVSPTTGAGYASGVVTAAFTLDPAEVQSVIFTATINAGLPRGTTIRNEAEIEDAVGVVWQVDTSFDVENADFSMSQKSGPASVAPGDTFTYTISVVNSGPLTATVTVTDLIPPGLEVITTALPTGVTYDPATGVISWTGVVSAAVPDRIVAGTVGAYMPISGTAGALQLTFGGNDDEGIESVTLPWSFSFLGNMYTALDVSPNGVVGFGGMTAPTWQAHGGNFNHAFIPDPANPNNQISAHFGDYCGAVSGGSGAVWAYHDTVNNRFLVEWSNMAECVFSGGANTFEIALYPDGRVEVYYAGIATNVYVVDTDVMGAATAEQGVENAAGTYGLDAFSYPNTPSTGANWSFYPAATGNVLLKIPVRVLRGPSRMVSNVAHITSGNFSWTTEPIYTYIHSAEFGLLKEIIAGGSGYYEAAAPWGEVVTYVLSVENVGTISATVTVADPLPNGVVVVTGSLPSGMTYDPNAHTVSWSGTITAGGHVRLEVPVYGTLAAAQADKALFNQFYVTDEWSRVYESNMTSLQLLSTEIEVVKFTDYPTVTPGDVITYTVILRNVGDNDTGWNALMVDNLPSGVTYVPGSLKVVAYQGIPTAPVCSVVGNNIVCSFQEGSSWTNNEVRFQYAVRVGSDVSAGTLLTNTVSVNDSYGVMSYGQSVVEVVSDRFVYLPLVMQNY